MFTNIGHASFAANDVHFIHLCKMQKKAIFRDLEYILEIGTYGTLRIITLKKTVRIL